MTERRICPVPGCPNGLSRLNTSGVCRKHNHAAGYCQCATCQGRPRKKRAFTNFVHHVEPRVEPEIEEQVEEEVSLLDDPFQPVSAKRHSVRASWANEPISGSRASYMAGGGKADPQVRDRQSQMTARKNKHR